MSPRVLSPNPAGRRGAVAIPVFVQRDGVRASAPPYYGFSFTGSEIHAFLYGAGTYQSTRAVIASSETSNVGFGEGNATLIHVDSEGLVGPGSIAFRLDDGSGIAVWDVEGGVIHTHAYQAAFLGNAPVYGNGWLWWVEVEEDIEAFTGLAFHELWRARADLSDPSRVQQVDIAHTTTEFHIDGGIIALTATAVFYTVTFGIEVVSFEHFRFLQAGGHAASGTSRENWIQPGIPDSLGNSVQGGFVLAGGDVDDWVSTAWGVGQAGTSQGGAEWSLYDPSTATLRRGPAEAGEPTTTFTVGNSPLGGPPNYFYIKG